MVQAETSIITPDQSPHFPQNSDFILYSFSSIEKSCSPFDRFGRKNGLLFIPSVGPGYDDTKIRPWNAAVSKDRCETDFRISNT